MRRGCNKSIQQRFYVLQCLFQGEGAIWGGVEPYGGRLHGPDGYEKERVHGGKINGPGDWGGPVLGSYIRVPTRGQGKWEDNQARDVSNFSSHSHRSHFVVKMQVQDQTEETSYTHKGQVEVITN